MIRWPGSGAVPPPMAPSPASPASSLGLPRPGFAGWSIPWPMLVGWTALWGYEFDHWAAALLVVAVLTAPMVVGVRWTFSSNWRRRAFWTVGLLTVVTGTYAWLAKIPGGPVWFTVSWFPVLLLPLMVEDRWGASPGAMGSLPLLVKAWPWSRPPTPRPAMARERWAHWAFQWPHRYTLPVVIYPRALYAGVVWATVLSGAVAHWEIALAVLSGLLGLKGVAGLDRRPWWEWIAFVLMLSLLGTGGYWAMRTAQAWVEDAGMRWIFNHRHTNDWFDPARTETRIGQTGMLDDGEALRFRVQWDQPPNTHLPVAVYDVVTNNGVQWDVSRRLSNTVPIKVVNNVRTLPGAQGILTSSLSGLSPRVREEIAAVDPGPGRAEPELRRPSRVATITLPDRPPHAITGTGKEKQVVLIGDLVRTENARVPLPLPANSRFIIGMDSATMAQNAAGSVLVTSAGTDMNLRVQYSPDPYQDLQPPSIDDRRVPPALGSLLDQALQGAGVRSTDTADQAAQRLLHWFQAHYHYTLNLGDPATGGRSLAAFLTQDREGHCEYFATATALLLRQAGIPARYVTGVLVNEAHPDEDPNMYWVRDRNFHAWVVYWDGAGWKPLDTTPSDLGAAWAADRPWYIGLSNAWLHWEYVLGNLDLNAWEASWALPLLAVLVALIAAIAWFQRHRFQTLGGSWWRRRTRLPSGERLPASEQAFEARLAQVLAEHPRRGEEPWGIWARRVGDPRWQKAVEEHYQDRYGSVESARESVRSNES